MLQLKDCLLRQGDFSLKADLTITKGSRVAVLGPSGGGKSTLLAAVAGFLAPAVGQVYWNATPMPDHPGERPLSILFQDNNLFPHLSVFQNVALGVAANLRLSAGQKTPVTDALGHVGLSSKADAKPADLSGGQQSRVALARVLVRKRPLLLLDEPFAALGPALKVDMLGLLNSIAKDTTILMVTHDPADAKAFADQVVLVADGVAQAPVPTDQIFANPPAALAAYLGK